MAKQVKDEWLGARVDAAMLSKVNDYVHDAEDLNMGELVRRAVNEYMINHPIKKAQENQLTIPGAE